MNTELTREPHARPREDGGPARIDRVLRQARPGGDPLARATSEGRPGATPPAEPGPPADEARPTPEPPPEPPPRETAADRPTTILPRDGREGRVHVDRETDA